MKFFHYLFENHPGKGDVCRLDEKTVEIEVPNSAGGVTSEILPVDRRDQRVLVVVDGELLCESIPKAGDSILSVSIGELKTHISHLRMARFDTPSYRIEKGKDIARLELFRHFLLLPAGNFVFCRVRDKRSLGPMYVFGEVRKSEDGPSVVWHNSTY